MKKLNGIGGVLLAMAIVLGSAQVTTAHAVNTDTLNKEEENAVREIAYTATLAKFVSTNCQAFVAALAPSVRERWQNEELSLRVRGVQLFLPDFFKVAYVYNGSINNDVFCFGLYNPFYDHMLLCKAKGLTKTEVVDYKWVSGSVLRGDKSVPAKPLSMGVNPPEEYFPSMLRVLGNVIKKFNQKLVKVQPDKAFASIPALDTVGVKRLVDMAVLRAAQGVKMSGDKQAFGLATLLDLIVRDERFANSPFVGDDHTTKAVLKALKSTSAEFRNAFRTIGYFEANGEKCVLSYNTVLPTFLLMARTVDGSVIKLGMFDAHIADGWEQRVDASMGNAK